jgi:nitronate monooxygenase
MSHPLFGTRIIAAPMAGGTSTPAFVRAVHEAGGLGFLAAGYKSVSAMEAEIRSTRESGARFGMNVFVPDPAQLDPAPDVRARLLDYRSRCRLTPSATACSSRRRGWTTTMTGRGRLTPC